MLAVAAPALAAPTTVSGVVVGQDGSAVAFADLYLRATDPDRDDADLTAEADGTFAGPVEPGTYQLCVDGIVSGFSKTCRPFSVGTTGVSGLRIELTALPRITGRVTNDAGANARVHVEAFKRGADGVWEHHPGTAETDRAGRFSLPADVGTYRLRFDPVGQSSELLSEYYQDSTTFESSRDVVVGPGGVAGVNAVLERGSVVRGRLTSPDPAQDFSTVTAFVYDPTTDEGSSAPVGSDGTYAVAVAPGEHVVSFISFDQGPGAEEEPEFASWTSEGLTFDPAEAELVEVGQHAVVRGIDGSYATSGIVGSVVSQLAAGDEWTFGSVYAYRSDATSTDVAQQDYANSQDVDLSAGRLHFSSFSMSLPAGGYKLVLEDEMGELHWLGGSGLADARTVQVVSGQKTTGADFKLGTTASAPLRARPTLTGTPNVGATLTVEPGAWASGTEFDYHWSNGAAGRTYTVTPDDAQAVVPLLHAFVQARVPGWEPIDLATPPASLPTTGIPVSLTQSTAAPVILGTPQVGQVLSTDGGAWSPGNVSRVYGWRRNGVNIPHSDAWAPTYRLTPADVGQRISLTVSAQAPGRFSTVVVSAETAPVAPGTLSTPSPSISGKAKVKKRVYVTGLLSSPGSSASIQWLRSGAPIPGATGEFYKIAKADKGKKKGLSVRVTWSLPGYTSVTKVSPVVKVK